jgi:hypothetical protein
MKCYDKILKDLFKSITHGNIVALKLKGVEKNVLTSVKEIRANSIVILNPITVYGSQLDYSVLFVEDIQDVRLYKARYSDPVYVRIRELKNNIDEIRRNLHW